MWYSKSAEEVLTELDVDPLQGLSSDEAASRLRKNGANRLQGKKKKNLFQVFLSQLKDWLIYILMVAVIITLALGEYIDSAIIVLVIVTNAFLGLVQEVKAGKAIEALKKLSLPKALVRRDGTTVELDSAILVTGDILILDAGRYISADIRLLESANLQIEESSLTGESVPADKDASLVFEDRDTPLGDRGNMAFLSTYVTRGRGTGVVVETGMSTEVGKIAGILNTEVKSRTPLEIRLNKLGKTLGKLAIGICVVIFIVSLFQGRNLADMFLISVSLAVAAIPEGLAAIVAVVLSIGVTSLAKNNVIIKKLAAVETLGSVNIICTDKTGTLTQNKMTVTRYFNMEGEKIVGQPNTAEVSRDAFQLAKALVICSDATFEKGHGTGDPTEIALLIFGETIGIDTTSTKDKNVRIGEFPFDSDRKLMSTLNSDDGNFSVYTKGAVINLLTISTHVLEKGEVVPITEAHRDAIHRTTVGMANDSLRTLGVAYKPANADTNIPDFEKELTFIGIVGMVDPPRTEARSSILQAKNAGITTLMITGDHKNTAYAIARELGIAESMHQAISGIEMDAMSDKVFSEKVKDYRIFARVSPEHKVKIIKALKAEGNIVSMTGDGVNDAPSLNAADIGVAMGITGTDVAKGAADMILTDDNFATIVTAIEQGRNIYNNIKKSIVFLLTCNLGEVVAVFATLLVGWEAPLIATQLLWINLITDSFPAIALGMDPGSKDVMKEKPRDPRENFLGDSTSLRIMLGGLVIGGLTIFAYWFGFYEHGYTPFASSIPTEVIEYARTMAFMALVLCQLFYSLAVRSSFKSILKVGLFSNKYLTGAILLGVALQLAVISVPFMQQAFHLRMLDMKGWGVAVSLGLVPLLLNEFVKLFIRAQRKKTLNNPPQTLGNV